MMAVIKKAILNIIKNNHGIDENKISRELEKINPEYLKVLEHNPITFLMDEMVGDELLEMVDYKLPEGEKIKSLYFPKGTQLAIW